MLAANGCDTTLRGLASFGKSIVSRVKVLALLSFDELVTP